MRKRKKRFLDIGYILTYNIIITYILDFVKSTKKRTATNVTAIVYI